MTDRSITNDRFAPGTAPSSVRVLDSTNRFVGVDRPDRGDPRATLGPFYPRIDPEDVGEQRLGDYLLGRPASVDRALF